VSFWGRLRARFTGDEATEPDASASDSPSPRPAEAEGGASDASRQASELACLVQAGQPDGPTVAAVMALLRQARGTVREAEALESALSAGHHLPEPARIACAEMLAARGDEAAARRLLEKVCSTAGLILAADLFAQAGDLARAAGTVERVLARDIDAPGALERHERWRRALGWESVREDRLDEETVLAARPEGVSYRLIREVARGGAGTVYEAEEPLLARRVAFKVYHRRGLDRKVVEREVRGAIDVAGPGVIRLYDASPEDGWIALEWITRGSVRDLLRSGQFLDLLPMGPWATALARALARLHDAGWVHGDVKPANVLLRGARDPVLGDFGIARRRGESMRGGSPGYVSPERLAGAEAEPRDDVYGFGRILEDFLHRVTGADGSSNGSAAASSEAPELAERAVWQELSLRCLAPAGERPADGAALVEAIERARLDSG